MNRRKVTIATGAAVLLLAGAVGVVRAALKCTPGLDSGYVSGYDSPQTLVPATAGIAQHLMYTDDIYQ